MLTLRVGLVCWCVTLAACDDDTLSPRERLGRQIFFDTELSLDRNQACAACHGEATGGTGPDEQINRTGAAYQGSVAGRFGNRKPNTIAYATFAPVLTLGAEGTPRGGNFWDGRATGWRLGSAAADQAQGPFVNELEQALPDGDSVVQRVCAADYGALFRAQWGERACQDLRLGFEAVAVSITAWEASVEVSPFSSKFDAVLAGRAGFTAEESQGLALFEGKAQCSRCHPSTPSADGMPPLFTDFTFDNLGVPRNPDNPFYAMDPAFVDLGLGGFLETLLGDDHWRQQPFVSAALARLSRAELEALARDSRGKQRVPTLRNLDKRPAPGFVKAYTHNGFFKSLAEVVHFYNTRDTLPWPAPEVAENVNRDELGHLGLDAAEEQALVAFLGTLSDGWSP
jgi:cytochrome c peroxidase